MLQRSFIVLILRLYCYVLFRCTLITTFVSDIDFTYRGAISDRSILIKFLLKLTNPVLR